MVAAFLGMIVPLNCAVSASIQVGALVVTVGTEGVPPAVVVVPTESVQPAGSERGCCVGTLLVTEIVTEADAGEWMPSIQVTE